MPPAEFLMTEACGCDAVANRMSEYLDGELEPPVARTIAAHLSRCTACARLAFDLALTIATLRRLSPARRVTFERLAGSFLCGGEPRPASPRFSAAHMHEGDEP